MQWIAPAEKDSANSTLEKRLWDAADQFRANSGLKAQEYSGPILGLIFLRFAEVRFAAQRAKLEKAGASSRRGSRVDEPAAYHADGIHFLSPEARYDFLLKLPESSNIGAKVNAAMRDIEKLNPQLAGVLFKTYNIFTSALLKGLLKKVSEIPADTGYDAFGRIYEYFLGEFARTEGQKGGEFYTPSAIVRLLTEVIEPFHGRILDPACGSGGMFVQSARFVEEHQKNPAAELAICGVEKTDETGRLCRMNLAVHGLEGDIRHGGNVNSYYDDPHAATGQFDFVLANPPFNVDAVDKERLKDMVGLGRRFSFGLPRTDNANYLWIQLFYSALNAKGRAGFVMANSASDARSSELEIRQKLIEARAVDVMIAVGPNMFYTVTLPSTLWFFDRGKAKTKRADQVLFIDARHIYRQIDRAHRDWTPGQIGLIANIVRLYRGEAPDFTLGGAEAKAKLQEIFGKKPAYADVLGLCKVASIEEIEAQRWSLDPARFLTEAPDGTRSSRSSKSIQQIKSGTVKEVFISYKWGSPAHIAWVEKLYAYLRIKGIDAKLDRYDVAPGTSFSEYMTRGMRQADHMIFVVNEEAVRAVESGVGALAFEMQIANARRLAAKGPFSIIPLLREGDYSSTYLSDHRYLDFRDDEKFYESLEELVGWLKEEIRPPELGFNPQEATSVERALPILRKLQLPGYGIGNPAPGEIGQIELGRGKLRYVRRDGPRDRWDSTWEKNRFEWSLVWDERDGIAAISRLAASDQYALPQLPAQLLEGGPIERNPPTGRAGKSDTIGTRRNIPRSPPPPLALGPDQRVGHRPRSRHAYTEDQLIGKPAIELFAALGWQTVSANDETFGNGGTLGRETKGEVLLLRLLRAALVDLNPAASPEAITAAIDDLVRDRSAMSLEAANRETYLLLKDGVRVSIPDHEHGGQKTERLRVVDWQQPANNHFLLVSQLSVVGGLYRCRPDLVGFVNGLPWVVIELKKLGVPARAAFDGNLTHYKEQIPALFWHSAFLIASNGTESRVGSLTADWERFFEWKRIASEDEPRRVSLEVILRGTCDPNRLFDLVENFTLFSEHKAGLVKVIGQNHQFLGVNNAIGSMLEARQLGHGRGGVFWQTQGSGKSFSMVFFAQKILRKLPGNWTFVIVTDRVDLDEQIAKTFKAVGAVSEAEGDDCHAGSGAHLRELLRGNHRYVFTLIQKFQTAEMLCDRSDVIVLTDEAHRSQYDTLAINMRAALPKATFLAFTGTPLIAGEERTREVFGDYVSVYDFRQSVEDGATVPLFYENRTPELELVNPDLNDDIYQLIEDADLDPEQEAKLERELGRQYHLLTRDDRLETVAQDIVRHFLGRGFLGKAMVVSIDKATALRMYDNVKKHWAAEEERVRDEVARYSLPPARRAELKARLEVLTSTDMALIVSPGQNEIAQMKKLGLDIEPHRLRMNSSQPPLDEKFKDTEDPLKLVFVCAMWLTGFDAPSCSTVYLDKPMRNHTLMQTIARANRVFPGKHSGIIVDYANVFASLEKALAIYGAGKDGKRPVEDKQALVKELRQAVAEVGSFCSEKGVKLDEIEALAAGDLRRLSAVEAAIDALISPDALRRDFFERERLVATLYRGVKPDPAALEFTSRVALLAVLAGAIRAKVQPNPPNISEVMAQIAELLDGSIAGIEVREAGPPPLDLSKINFEALAARFEWSKHQKTDLEELKAAIRAKLEKMVRINRTRADFQEKLEELIDSYNAGSRSIEELFRELLKLSMSLNEEEQRHVRENLSEEELVIFDILTRPAPELSTAERAEVKKVARELLAKLKELLVLNWRKKASARSQVRLAIEDSLDSGLPRVYSPEVYQLKCSAVFEHVYEAYPERALSI